MGNRSGRLGASRVLVALAIIGVALPWQFARGAGNALPRRQMRHEIFYRIRTSQPMVALTFDDGPNSYTPQILGFLRDAGAHATFFVVGHHALDHRDLVRAIIDGDNEVANHTWDHPHLTALLESEQKDEIVRGAGALAELGVHPVWFRPPYGLISSLGVRDALALGERTVLWSMALDHEYRVHGERADNYMLRNVRPGDIILAHDARPKTFGCLQRLLAGLRERGFAVLTVSELAAEAKPF